MPKRRFTTDEAVQIARIFLLRRMTDKTSDVGESIEAGQLLFHFLQGEFDENLKERFDEILKETANA